MIMGRRTYDNSIEAWCGKGRWARSRASSSSPFLSCQLGCRLSVLARGVRASKACRQSRLRRRKSHSSASDETNRRSPQPRHGQITESMTTQAAPRSKGQPVGVSRMCPATDRKKVRTVGQCRSANCWSKGTLPLIPDPLETGRIRLLIRRLWVRVPPPELDTRSLIPVVFGGSWTLRVTGCLKRVQPIFDSVRRPSVPGVRSPQFPRLLAGLA